MPQRREVVEDPKRTSVRGDRQVVVLYDQVIYGRHWQVELQGLPVRSVVEADIHAALGARVEQAFALGIDAHRVNIDVLRDAVHDGRPAFSEISGLENVGSEIVHLVPLDRHVRGACVVWRGFDHADRAPFGHGLGRNIVPVTTAISCHVNKSVIAAVPNQVLLHGRLNHREDGVVHLDASVVLGDRAAGRLLLRFVVAREIGRDDGPTLAFVRGLKQDFAGVVERVWLVRRKHDRLGPLEAMLQVCHSPANRIARPRIHHLSLLGVMVVARDLAAVGAGVDDVSILGIRSDVPTLPTADSIEVGAIDTSICACAGDGHGGIVLLRPVEPVWEPVVGSDMVELRGRLVHHAGPTGAAVGRNGRAPIVAVDQALGIVGIDPQPVVVAMRRAQWSERFARIDRTVSSRVQDVNDVRIFGVGEDVGVVPCALAVLTVTVRELPFLAPIVGAEQAALLSLNQGVHAARVRRRGHADASESAFGQAFACQFRPRVAAVGRAIETAAGTARFHRPRFAHCLPHAGKQNVGI